MPTDPTTIPGWAWKPGMLAVMDWTPTDGGGPLCARLSTGREAALGWTVDDLPKPSRGHRYLPDPTDAATAGCLLALLGPEARRVRYFDLPACWSAEYRDGRFEHFDSLGAACIAVAGALGKWPGG